MLLFLGRPPCQAQQCQSKLWQGVRRRTMLLQAHSLAQSRLSRKTFRHRHRPTHLVEQRVSSFRMCCELFYWLEYYCGNRYLSQPSIRRNIHRPRAKFLLLFSSLPSVWYFHYDYRWSSSVCRICLACFVNRSDFSYLIRTATITSTLSALASYVSDHLWKSHPHWPVANAL